MRLNRFITDFNFSNEEVSIIDTEIIKQIRGVLRLEAGDNIILLDGKGKEVETKIISLSKDKIQGKILRHIEVNEPERKVSLYLAILKKENFELVVQKAVECGVTQITPVITERTVKTGLNFDRLNKIIKETTEQCGRSIVPSLSPIINFEQALEVGKNADEKIIFHLSEKEYQPDGSKASVRHSVSIFIGPEGGFTEKELELAQETGYTVASLGNLVLRGETAAIVATYRAVQGI